MDQQWREWAFYFANWWRIYLCCNAAILKFLTNFLQPSANYMRLKKRYAIFLLPILIRWEDSLLCVLQFRNRFSFPVLLESCSQTLADEMPNILPNTTVFLLEVSVFLLQKISQYHLQSEEYFCYSVNSVLKNYEKVYWIATKKQTELWSEKVYDNEFF